MKQERLQPNYYAIIPANIRYDKNLNSTEKLLYAEITALCDKEGYCWASNNYFAEILNRLPAYISQVLTKLYKKEYITIEIERNNKGTFRKIYIGKIIGKIHTEKESKIIKKENKTTESKTIENEKIFTETEKIHTENSIEGDIEITTEGVQKKLYGGIEKTREGYRNNYIQKNNTINNTKEYKKEKILKENFEEHSIICLSKKFTENSTDRYQENPITCHTENTTTSDPEITTTSDLEITTTSDLENTITSDLENNMTSDLENNTTSDPENTITYNKNKISKNKEVRTNKEKILKEDFENENFKEILDRNLLIEKNEIQEIEIVKNEKLENQNQALITIKKSLETEITSRLSKIEMLPQFFYIKFIDFGYFGLVY